jgi:purine-nucleoside phosphorylase
MSVLQWTMSLQKKNHAIVQPRPLPGFADLPALALLVGNDHDLTDCRRAFGRTAASGKLFFSRISRHIDQGREAVLAGPVIGAPQAAMVLETLIAGGVEQILYLGWCGSIVPHLHIGDFVLPSRALINEGTSPQYQMAAKSPFAKASRVLVNEVAGHMAAMGIAFQEDDVWTTDAIFRETGNRVAYFRSKGAVAVEMETSALFTVADFHGARIASLLVVSDELDTGKWIPGFRHKRFQKSRKKMIEVALRQWRNI